MESKAGLFDESVMVVGHSEMFSRKTRTLRKALDQAWSASTGLRRKGCAPASVLEAKTDYLLIVTNKELSAGRGTSLAQMYPAGDLSYPCSEAEQYLPLENVYILSIEDFERLMAVSRSPDFDLPIFLHDCVVADQAPETSVFYFEQHLDRKQIPRDCSQLVVDAIDAIEGRLTRSLASQQLTRSMILS